MPRLLAAALLLCSLAPAQEVVPAGITCCDEEMIRRAMTEEALQRVIARHEQGSGAAGDYLSAQAHEAIRRRLPAGGRGQVLDFLRAALGPQAPETATGEFQRLIGLFVLGMTLEIGHTFQDEYDRAQAGRERIDRLVALLEAAPGPRGESLRAALFHADISERELRRIRTLELKWRDVEAGAPPFAEFSVLRKNICGHAADPDQRMAFELAGRYRASHPFLDEFLGNYRRLAAEIREAARRVNALLASTGA
jgi:hypothetical protein